MSTIAIDPTPGEIGRVRVPNFRKIETPDLKSREAVEKLFRDAARVTKAERSRRSR